MLTPHPRAAVLAVLLLASFGVSACRRTYVIVPRPAGGYSATDTLYGRSDGRNVRVTFHFDTTYRVDTVVRTDTLWRGGTRIIQRVDTLRTIIRDTVIIRSQVPSRLPDVPTRTPTTTPTPVPTPGAGRVDTVRIIVRDTVRLAGRDTVRLTVRDTLRLVVRDTVVRVDTLRLPGRRMLFVPPGQYPPEGQCRVWIHDRPPGQQERPAPCNALGAIPAGAFILFGGEAWDADYDWVAEARRSAVPPEIVAVTRRRSGRP